MHAQDIPFFFFFFFFFADQRKCAASWQFFLDANYACPNQTAHIHNLVRHFRFVRCKGRQRRPFAQSDQDLRCPLSDSLDLVEDMKEQKSTIYCQSELNKTHSYCVCIHSCQGMCSSYISYSSRAGEVPDAIYNVLLLFCPILP